ncbi:MAG TPA: peptidyl-prolyl cis-trans isomerase [Gemmatimonadales bacterium]|nr:peptidyl-prolyl cis-trans isomerase [Gemmatimonadales bacterium]
MSMQVFRNSAKPLIYIVTASFFLWLVFDLSGLSGGTGLLSQTSAGKVDGQTIEARYYTSLVQQTIEQEQRTSARPLTLDDIVQIRNQVWQQIVEATVLQREYKRRGLVATPEEIANAIESFPPSQLQAAEQFQTDGQFDRSKYQRWLASDVGQQYIPMLEAQYRDQILQSKLLRVVTSDVYLSDPALWQMYRDRSEKATVELAAILPRRAIADSAVQVSSDEIAAYYKANPDRFSRPATAYLSFIVLPRHPNASDTAAAYQRAVSARQEILDGAPFAEIAARESSDSVSASKGGDLGEWTRGSMVPSFDSAAFALPLNTVSMPVLSDFGYHLIEITGRKGDKATGRHVLFPIEVTGVHRDEIDARADSLEELGASRLDPAALDTAARALQLPIGTTLPVQKGTRVQIGAQVLPEAGEWAFQAKVGEISPIVEVPDGFYLFRLDSLVPEGVPPLTTVEAAVASFIILDKKIAMARELAESLLKRVQEGSTLEQAATALGLPYRKLGPFSHVDSPVPNPVLTGAVFSLPVGALSGVLDTDDGLYVVRVLERTPADTAAFRKGLDDYRTDAIRRARQDRARSYLDALQASAKVVDRREGLFPTSAQAEANASSALGGKRGS